MINQLDVVITTDRRPVPFTWFAVSSLSIFGLSQQSQAAVTADVINLSTLNATQGFIIQGDATSDQTGRSVSGAGDVNGDGFNDMIVGAYRGDDGGGSAGEAYVVFGGAGVFGVDVSGRQVVDLTTLSASEGFILQGDNTSDEFGYSVSNAGDVNGDGYGDLIVGAKSGEEVDAGNNNEGETYVVFGGSGTFGVADGVGRQVIDMTTLNASEGFVIRGDTASDRSGYSVSSAGDVNGDGFDDMIVGAIEGDDGGGGAGEAYVVFGGSGSFGNPLSGRQVLELSGLTSSEGFIIQGGAAGDSMGHKVADIGDINDDGFADIMVSAPFTDDSPPDDNEGEAYVIYGGNGTFGTNVFGRQVIDTTTLSAAEGFVIVGEGDSDQVGRHRFSKAGDINNDGIADIVINAPFSDNLATNSGEAHVIFGTTSGFGAPSGGRQVLELASLSPSEGFVIAGGAETDKLQSSSGAGDFNNDGIDDLIVGAIENDAGGTDAGAAYVVYGGTGTFGTTIGGRQVLELANLSSSEGLFIQGDMVDDEAGNAIAALGDINGDGIADIMVGAEFGDDAGSNAGEAYVIFGGFEPEPTNVPLMGVPATIVLLVALIAIGKKALKL